MYDRSASVSFYETRCVRNSVNFSTHLQHFLTMKRFNEWQNALSCECVCVQECGRVCGCNMWHVLFTVCTDRERERYRKFIRKLPSIFGKMWSCHMLNAFHFIVQDKRSNPSVWSYARAHVYVCVYGFANLHTDRILLQFLIKKNNRHIQTHTHIQTNRLVFDFDFLLCGLFLCIVQELLRLTGVRVCAVYGVRMYSGVQCLIAL